MATATLRPNSTFNAVASITGAATTDDAVSDDSDSSYIRITRTDSAEVYLSNHAMGTGRLYRVRPRFRARATDVINNQTYIINWFLVTDDGNTVAVGFATFPLTSFEEDEAAYVDLTLTQAQLDGLRLRATASISDVEIAEMYVDIIYVTEPVAGIVNPTGTVTTTTQPSLEWTRTFDTSGTLPDRYQIRVFDQSTFNPLTTVDPDTDTPFSDSGVVVGGNLGNPPFPDPLPNGDSYRVAARFAQFFNGAEFWSPWDTEDITINVTVSDIDTVTAVADNATGSITVTVNRDTSGGNPAWEVLEVEYSQDAGSSWEPVRFATAVAPDTANSHDVTHYEAVRDVDTLYRARATYYSAGLPITGAWVQSTAVQWTGKTEFVKVLSNPSLNVAVDRFVSDPEPRFARRAGELDVIGRADPIVRTDGVRKTPAGRVTFQTETVAQADAVSAALNAASPLLLDVPADLDFDTVRYVHVRDDQVRFNGRRSVSDYRLWTIDYRVIGTPPDDTAGTL